MINTLQTWFEYYTALHVFGLKLKFKKKKKKNVN